MSRRRVLLVGWDGADWKVITPLIDAGKMPNIERLINRGVMGDIATLEPVLSPTLWTSIATGKRPYKHGILGFIEPTPNGLGVQPVSILSRRTRALWNMMTLEGLTANVVGWWPSHPAEPINGVIISNHYQRSVGMIDQPWPMRPGTVHPERLTGPLSKLRLHPQELLPEQLLAFVPDAAKIDQEKDRRLHNLAKTIAECASIQAAATALMQLEPWDFMGVYFDSIDHFSHGFMHYHPPRLPHVPEADFELYRHVIEGAYRLHDMMLGVLLDLAGDDVTVMLISDHGFHPDKLRPVDIPTEPAGPAIQHRTHGIFVLAGPGIKQDERIYGASVLDITPTILALYDLPVGEDMDGKALVSAFEQPPALRSIPSWDDVEGADGRHPPETAFDPVEAGEELRQLAALGYIDAPDSDGAKAAADAEVELRYNLARAYKHGLRYLDAITALQGLRELRPEDERFGLQLVSCLNALERHAEARAVLDETIAVRQQTMKAAQQELQAWLDEHGGQMPAPGEIKEKEQRKLRRLRARAGWNPPAHYLLGAALHRVGRIPAAVEALSVCLAQNPNYFPAHQRLTHIYRKRLQNEERASYHERMAKEAKKRHSELRKGGIQTSGGTVGRTPVLAARDHAATTAPAFTGTLADTIVVVSGLPRSGTSMMMRMLDQGGLPLLTDAVRTADDGNRHGYFEYEPVKGLAKDSAWIDEARGKAVKIVSPLLLHLPRADDRSYRIILMERDVREIADSQQKLIALLGGKGPHRSLSALQAALAHRAESTHRLLDLWGLPTLTISYKKSLADPVGTAAAVNRFLGGTLDETAMAAAVDATQYRSTAK